MEGRNDLARAIRMVESGEADVLMATKIDRVSRSVADFAEMINRAKRKDWVLVVLDLGVDLSTATGRLIAHVLISVAEFEREMISDRTKAGLAAAKSKGVKLGASVLPGVSDVLCERISAMRADGMTLIGIADQLNEEKVPTARGGKRWWPSTVNAVLSRVAAA
jgi:DNA invertase Pin-like site-specific DNA recombinase